MELGRKEGKVSILQGLVLSMPTRVLFWTENYCEREMKTQEYNPKQET